MKELHENLMLIEEFKKSPIDNIKIYWQKKSIKHHDIILSKSKQNSIISTMSSEDKHAIDVLSDRLNDVNLDFMSNQDDIKAGLDTKFNIKTIKNVGIYIPRNLPSTAYTFLSAAAAAGVEKPIVFLAENADGTVSSSCVYAANKYNATIITAPAAFGFLTLSFGIEDLNILPVDLVCGPCSNRLNDLKQLVSLISKVKCDMYAGSSDIAIVVDETANWNQVEKDIVSQLEHGFQSHTHLILINKIPFTELSKLMSGVTNSKAISIYHANGSLEEAANIVNEISPETVELWTRENKDIEQMIVAAGVVYDKLSSSLGDYGAIGRGCADPTGGMSRTQSGLSPFTFLKYQPYVSSKEVAPEIIEAASHIAGLEGLLSHKKAIDISKES